MDKEILHKLIERSVLMAMLEFAQTETTTFLSYTSLYKTPEDAFSEILSRGMSFGTIFLLEVMKSDIRTITSDKFEEHIFRFLDEYIKSVVAQNASDTLEGGETE